jgi:XRE family transcriptional regulator, regulator of sulfur utilization
MSEAPSKPRVLTQIAGEALVEALDVTFPAGHVRSSKPHPAGVIEHLLLTVGRLRAGPLDALVDLDTGDVLRFAGDVPHSYAAIGDDARAIILMAYPTAALPDGAVQLRPAFMRSRVSRGHEP